MRAHRCATALVTCALLAVAHADARGAIAPIVQPAAGGEAWTPRGVAKLAADLDALLVGAPALRGAHVGVVALDTAGGHVLYARAADDEFQPASTLKLVAGSAALDRLGPRFAFHTTVTSAAPGGVPGSLVLHGGGDPMLSTADLAEAAKTLAARNLSEPQTLSVDASHFVDEPYAAGWTWDDFGQYYAPKISAMTLDENVVSVRVAPALHAGLPAIVFFNDAQRPYAPPDPCHPANVSVAITGASDSEDTIDVERRANGCVDVVGSIPAGAKSESVDAAVEDPVAYSRETLANALTASGITVAPAPALETQPGEIVWSHTSSPLATSIGPNFWIPSDNLFGELLLRELGFADGGAPGSIAKGVAAEKRWLQSIGVDPATVTLADGCGMSQYDRITPRDLVTILQHDWNGPNRQLVLDSLPVGGARGTIEGVSGTAAGGRVFAKTGSMMHVRGLAGYLATQRHGAVTFAFEVDDWNGDYASLAALRARVLSRIVTDPS